MRLIDFPSFSRSSIGFDRLFDMMDNAVHYEPTDAYPPYNIEKTGDDAYRITLAVAGFGLDELTITSQANQLVVAGTKAPTSAGEYPISRHRSARISAAVQPGRPCPRDRSKFA